MRLDEGGKIERQSSGILWKGACNRGCHTRMHVVVAQNVEDGDRESKSCHSKASGWCVSMSFIRGRESKVQPSKLAGGGVGRPCNGDNEYHNLHVVES